MPMNTKNKNHTIHQKDFEVLKIQYQVLSERRINHNTLLWNVPSLLFVAQTFLWTLSLDSDKNLFLRCGISILSIIVAYISFQMFKRNRLMEIVDSAQMYSIEKCMQKHTKPNDFPVMIIHHKLEKRTLISGKYKQVSDFINNNPDYKNQNKKKSLCQMSSVRLWKTIFISMIVLSCFIFGYNLLHFPMLNAGVREILSFVLAHIINTLPTLSH